MADDESKTSCAASPPEDLLLRFLRRHHQARANDTSFIERTLKRHGDSTDSVRAFLRQRYGQDVEAWANPVVLTTDFTEPGSLGLSLEERRDCWCKCVFVQYNTESPSGAGDRLLREDCVYSVAGQDCSGLAFKDVVRLIRDAGRPLSI